MRMLKILLFFSLLTGVSTSLLQAYNYLPTVKCYNKTQYQAGRQNWDVDFDSNGIVYFANSKGLLRYVYGNWVLTPTSGNEMVRSICVVNDTIWSGGIQEYGYFVKNSPGDLSYVKAGGVPSGQVWEIESFNNKIYLQTEGSIIIHDKAKAKGEIIYSESGFYGIQLWNNQMWAISRNGSIGVIENNEFIEKDKINQLNGVEVRRLYEYNNRLIILLFDGRVLSYDGNDLINEKLPAYIEGKALFTACPYENDEYLVGTISNGLIHINGKTQQVLTKVNTDNGLIDNTVLAIGKDAMGNVWLGLDYGIAYVEMKNTIKPVFDQGATYFIQDVGNATYLATNKGLYVSQGQSSFELIKGSEGQVWRLRIINNELYACHNLGLFKVEGKQLKSMFVQEGIMDVANFPGTNVYLLSAYSGLLLAKYQNGRYHVLQNLYIWGNPKLVYDSPNNCIWADSKWASTHKITLNEELKVEVKNYENIATFFKGENRFVFYDGNQLLNYDNGEFRAIKEAPFNNITGDGIVALDFDEKLNFVSYIQNGTLDMLANLHDGNFYSYKKLLSSLKDHLVDNDEFIDIHNGELRVATDRGVSTFNVDSRSNYSSGFNAIISKVHVHEDDTNLQEFIFPYVSEQTVLSAGDKNILFHFGVKKSTSDHVDFRYRLWPYDRDWSEWTSSVKVKEYTRLNGGHYKFLLQSRLNGGQEKEQSFEFVIDKFWYQTKWVILPYALLFAVCILITIHIMRRIHRRSLVKEKEMYKKKEAVQSLAMKNEQLLKYTEVISRKNEFLIEVKDGLARMRNADARQWENKIIEEVNSEKKNFFFHKLFSELHQDFINRLTEKYPSLTANDVRMLSFIRINLDSREIANMMNISPKSVDISRYRIRKKMELPHETDLNQFIRDL
ncbi:hypothetical protein E9993_06980 [Labilibacter sediminis]|nr:hypothetical protein E9993_06980 [Labilibacter sediminis]